MSEIILKEIQKFGDASVERYNDIKKDYNELKEEISELKKAKGRLQLNTGVDAKTFNDEIKSALEAKYDDMQKFYRGEKKSFDIELKAVADVSTSNVTGGTVFGAAYKPGIITNPNQIGHIRSFLNVTNAGPGTDYYFMRENGGEGAPAPTKEKGVSAATTQATGLKPQFDIDLVESSVKFETIAGFMVASKKSLANIPGFVSFLQRRVPEKLFDVEDSQILYGDGASPNLKGILTAGNFIQGSTAGTTPLSEKIINDMSLLEDTHKRAAAAVWVRPADYWSFFKQKASGSGEYDLPSNVIFVNGQLYISGVPVYKTTAFLGNDYMVGAAMGADILQQESIRLEFFEQDGNNVRTNQVTIRVEETIALPVYGSNYFVKGSSALA